MYLRIIPGMSFLYSGDLGAASICPENLGGDVLAINTSLSCAIGRKVFKTTLNQLVLCVSVFSGFYKRFRSFIPLCYIQIQTNLRT